MNVEVLTEYMDFTMNAKEGIVSNCGRNLFNVSIAFQLLLWLMTKSSVFMEDYHQNLMTYNKLIKFLDLLMFQTVVYYVIFSGVILQTQKKT